MRIVTTAAHGVPAPDTNYANSHDIIRVSAKRLKRSPWLEHYVGEDAVFGIYGGRLYPLSLGADAVEDYWHLRNHAGLFDVPERPIEISGPEAEQYLNHLLTRDVSTVPSGRARYALACDEAGHILMDGVLIRWSDDRFWYVLADGDFLGWMQAQASNFDVAVSDPDSWVLQIQGPRSLDILTALADEPLPTPFPYFAATMMSLGGQTVLVTRTGWTGELGFEVYSMPDTDCTALWEWIISAGVPHGLRVLSLECMGIRRIEAGILDNGTDMDPTMTPFDVGLGKFVDLTKPAFIGRQALEESPRLGRLIGIAGQRAPKPGEVLLTQGAPAAHVRAGAWSPSLEQGIGYAILDTAPDGEAVNAASRILDAQSDGVSFTETSLPFLDPEKRLARGLQLESHAPGSAT